MGARLQYFTLLGMFTSSGVHTMVTDLWCLHKVINPVGETHNEVLYIIFENEQHFMPQTSLWGLNLEY